MTHTNNSFNNQQTARTADSEVNFTGAAPDANNGITVLEGVDIKKNRAARTSLGLKWVAAGALLGFFSCVCSICNPIESLYYVNLYGVSTMAVLIAFYGLYLIFE